MESAAAPAPSRSRANCSGLKFDRIKPRDGEAFFNSAMIATDSRLFSSSALRKPRGTCSAARRSSSRKSCHIRFDIEHRRAVDCIKALHFDCQALNREQAAHRDSNPVGPILPALSENAHFGPVRPPPGPARAKIDLGVWYAVERENNLHMGEFFEAFQAIGSK